MANPANSQPDSLIQAEKCKEYWETVASDSNGMLGGVLAVMPSVSRIDLQGSRTFLARLGVGIKSGRQRVPRVLEGGAGIGRITEGLLLKLADQVDVVEPVAKFTETLRSKPGVGEIHNVGLEKWEPTEGAVYDLIWIQWCIGHLNDEELVQFLEKCKNVLQKEHGLIVFKENLSTWGQDKFDELDGSVTREDEKFLQLFDRAGMKLQVLEAIEDKEEKFKWRRHDGSKIDKFRTLVKEALAPIQLIGDIVVNATKTVYPATEAIFAAMRYLISVSGMGFLTILFLITVKVSKSVSADYDKLENFFEDLRSYLTRLSVLQHNIPAIAELRAALTEVLVSTLVLCAICTRYLKTKRIEDSELKEAYENLRKAVEREKGVVRNCILLGVEQGKFHARAAVTGINENLALTERVDHKLEYLTERSNRMNGYLDSHEATVERENLIKWLSSLDFCDKQRSLFSKHHGDTGKWLLDSDEFQNWFSESDEKSTMLWCAGNPGSGKSVMMSTVINYLEESTKKDEVAIAYVYCDYKDKRTLSETSIWASVIRQMVEACSQLPPDIISFRDKYLEKRALPSDEERMSLIRSLSKRFRKTFILIDALDECPEENRDAFLQLARDVEASAHLLITSRMNLDLTESFSNLTQITIAARSSDVETYLDAKMKANSRMRSFLARDKALRNDIINNLVKKTDGMFLLAHLQIEYLCGRSNLRQVRSSLNSLVGKLEEFYDAAWQRIENLEEGDSLLAKKALSYVFYAKRPLTSEELFHALSVEPGDPELDDLAFTERHILLSVTAGMLQIGDNTDDARLIHLTLHEYFSKRQGRFLEPENQLAKTCLTYLSFDVFSTGPCEAEQELDKRMSDYALLGYASHHWGDHFAADQDGDDVREIMVFLEDEKRLASSMQAMCIPRHRTAGWHEAFPKEFTSLHAAAYWGLYDVLEPALESGVSIDHQDSHGMSALHLASRRGFAKLVQAFLLRGADTNLMNERGETAMLWAARNGHGKVMELLMANGADSTIEDNESWTALHWAVINRHDNIVLMLLDQHAQVVSDNSQTNKALILAAEAGSVRTVDLLLRLGAEIDAVDEQESPALHWAVPGGHEQAASVLLKNGANPNSRDCYENTPLHWAIPYDGITRLLLSNGANPNYVNDAKQSPLHWSAQAGFSDSTSALLEYGGDPNAPDSRGVTPLHMAVMQGHEPIVAQLLHAGADANAKDDDEWTPLHAAVVRGHDNLIELLTSGVDNAPEILDKLRSELSGQDRRNILEEIASNKSHGSIVVTGLRTAVNSGYKERIVSLIESGADIDAQDPIGESTALTQAAEQGRADLASLLLESGANPNQREKHGKTALQIAARNGHADVVTALVAGGADIDARVHGWTPVLLAAKNERFEVLEYLIRRGADANSVDYCGRTALHWVAKNGCMASTHLLLEMGADAKKKDHLGKTPYDWAMEEQHGFVASMLQPSEG
ncbi:ankyrin repeat-containing protein [Fusarium globosum]|uniref:Ankyrin repeat-containing protein n=1 Tax=Fusarium globosum TaxID=78864 RepID=A0A8H5YRY0_9HYPO|nr:ankyrin repeat-containing protein [Fusarium globosum]